MSAVETLLQEEAKLANCKESIDNGIVKEESDDSAVHSGDDEIGKNSNSPILLMYVFVNIKLEPKLANACNNLLVNLRHAM